MTRLWRVSSFPEEHVDKADKQKVVDELTERLRSAESLIVADYRGLTNGQLASLRTELLKHQHIPLQDPCDEARSDFT